jgi:hypothetical protein
MMSVLSVLIMLNQILFAIVTESLIFLFNWAGLELC